MNKTANEAVSFVSALIPHTKDSVDVAIYLAAPFTAISAASNAAENSSIQIGAQNMSEYSSGAYTGEVSAKMLKEAGVKFVLIGHSERRCLYHEEDCAVQAKLAKAICEDIQPIFCIGESEMDRETGRTEQVLKEQLENGLKGLTEKELSSLVIAYEPVWAIGTGKTATPEIADKTHLMCRNFLAKLYSEDFAKNISILYGGSVSPKTIDCLMQKKNIDGALVGGASLDVESFNQLIHFSRN